MTFADLQEALRVLGLGERATLREIKRRHRELLAYVDGYRLSFSEGEFYEQNPEARIRMQFADDPVGGGG